MRHLTALVMVALGLMLLAACGPLPMQPRVTIADPDHQAGSRAFAVDVKNHSGSVRIEASERFDRPSVVAITRDGQGQAAPATWAAASVERSDMSPILRVLCTPPAGQEARAVELTIRVPGCEGVRVQNSRGPVTVTGVRGAVDVQNGTAVAPGGDVAVTMGGLLDAPALVRSSSGSITMTVRPGSRGVLDLQASGSVTALLRKERTARVKEDRTRWSGVLNEGEHPVVLAAEAGDVRLRVVR
jgi:hypothetical protein